MTISDIDNKEVYFMYYEEGMSQQKIADYYNAGKSTIYNRLHPEQLKEHNRQYQLEHPEYNKQYRMANIEKIQEYNKQWRLEHPEYSKEYNKERRLEHPEFDKEYWQSDNGKICAKRYRHSDKGKVLTRKINAARRNLGFISLNESFPSSVFHHTDEEHGIYIPVELHKIIWHNLKNGQGMEEINESAQAWLVYEKLLVDKSMEEKKRLIYRFVESEKGIIANKKVRKKEDK